MDEARPLLELTGATVRFGADAAIDGVDFRMFPGEVHSLMGENGAGKSTLIKAITGALPLDEGELRLDGEPVRFATPHDAQRAGISTVYQEIDLLPNVSVAENIALGREPRRFGVIDWRRMRADAHAVLADLGIDIDPASILGTHSLAVQQLVAIARAISVDVKVLVLDEPTSSLDLDEVAELFRVIRELKQRGVAILFVSHFLDQVYEICDRVTVLRNGKLVGEYLTKQLLRIDLVQKMLGRSVQDLRTRPAAEERRDRRDAVPQRARHHRRQPASPDADVDLAEGEVLGVAGLLGSGRTELARALTGVDRLDAGIIRIAGRDAELGRVRRAISLGVVYSSENRRTEGIISELSVRENITLALQAQRGILRRIRPSRQRELAASWVEALDIRPADLDRPAGTLSGGNQQKLLLARMLALSPRVLVLDEPTRGIDVGAKVEIQNLVGELADNGLSVMFISAELEEVLRVGHRVAILRDGRIVDTLPSEGLTVESLMAMVARPDDDDAADGRGERVVSDEKGSRTANIFDVARLAGVSHQTVSRVLNDLPERAPATRARVEQAIAQLRYSPSPAARALVTRRTRTIGLVTPGRLGLRPDLDRDALQRRRARRALQRRDRQLARRRRRGRPRASSRACCGSGSTRSSSSSSTSAVLEAVRGLDLSIPVVAAASAPRRSPLIVSIDQYRGARAAVRHLAELGHQRILHLAGPQQRPGRDRARARLARRARRPPPRGRRAARTATGRRRAAIGSAPTSTSRRARRSSSRTTTCRSECSRRCASAASAFPKTSASSGSTTCPRPGTSTRR